ncbi:hypothetical protein [Afipia sp. GAS231]|uniref:hypothetical protein n=1 Tax=Afipia sp. GAS231 TaxID=1882747 RepID=UPI00087B280A|nr:hypothetical protein [Afipia sp. GAS231]SDM87997.1 hypothetical protein SAMN05444050_0084 [Afipia sp. GAS231]
MAFNADDILGHAALERSVRQLAQSLLGIHDASPRLASVFGTRQRWLIAHAACAQYFRNVAADGPGAGMLTAQLLDLVSRHKVASPNTAVAFRDEMVKYGVIQPVPGSESRRHLSYEPSQVTLAALFQWHILHLGTLDGFDGGGRSTALRADPQALRRLQPLIADGLLESHTVRQPDPTFALLAWVDEGGIVMDRLMVGCEQGDGGLDRVLTDLTSVTGLAQRLKLSRTQLGRKLAAAEAMGSLGWEGSRGRSRLWVSQGFRHEYHKAQANKLAVIDAACEACFMPRS